MPKIEIIENTVCNSRVCEKGEVIEASEKDARYLIGIKKAKPAAEKKVEQKPKKEVKKNA